MATKVLGRLSSSFQPHFNPSSGLFSAIHQPHNAWAHEPHMPPDRINACLNMVCAKSPSNTVPFSINCRSNQDRWSIRGLRFNRSPRCNDKSNIILVSGQRSQERNTIGVNLCLASMLAEYSSLGVAVSVVPNIDPREYERLWRREQAVGTHSSSKSEFVSPIHDEIIPAFSPMPLSSTPEGSDVCDGSLRYYIKRFGNPFSSLELNFSRSGAALKHKKDATFDPSNGQAPQFDFPFAPEQRIVPLPLQLTPLTEQEDQPAPTYVIELRDRQNSLEEDQISDRADQVMDVLRNLLRNKGTQGL